MIELSVVAETRQAVRHLDDLQKRQVPFAISLGINYTAKDVQQALEKGTSVFDRPRPATVRGTKVERSTKSNLTAVVKLKRREEGSPPVSEYLQAEVYGGARPFKRSEILLQKAGILPDGKQTRPGTGARLDAYGNMSRGQIVQIISYFKAFGGIKTSGRARGRRGTTTQSSVLNRTKPKKAYEYFVVPEGFPGLSTGIWERRGRKIQPVLIFIDVPVYRKKYKFYEIAKETVRARFDENFKRALNVAVSTAR